MVELLVVMNCGTSTYQTETFKDKKQFEERIDIVNDGYENLICFTDLSVKFVSVSPANCVIECNDV
jgi:hypothetical protein